MSNYIKSTLLIIHRLDPVEARIHILVHPQKLVSSTQVLGRILGPKSAYGSTVEVAHPLRELSREYETTGDPRISLAAALPEPCAWSPESPLHYDVNLELYQGNELCERMRRSMALHTCKLRPRELLWNGRPLRLRGVACANLTVEEARTLHQAGFNTLLVPARKDMSALWELGDRFGFLILARITDRNESPESDDGWRAAPFGTVLAHGLLTDPMVEAVGPKNLGGRNEIVGLDTSHDLAVHSDFSFLLCPENSAAAQSNTTLLKIIVSPKSWTEASSEVEPVRPDILGRIFRWGE
jgi:hypothetical protein